MKRFIIILTVVLLLTAAFSIQTMTTATSKATIGSAAILTEQTINVDVTGLTYADRDAIIAGAVNTEITASTLTDRI